MRANQLKLLRANDQAHQVNNCFLLFLTHLIDGSVREILIKIHKDSEITKYNKIMEFLMNLGGDDEVESNAGAPSVAGSVTGATVDDSLVWPSMQDLNTRLRRVITSYQRNYKKEELKQQQKAKVNFSAPIFFHRICLLRSTFDNLIEKTILAY